MCQQIPIDIYTCGNSLAPFRAFVITSACISVQIAVLADDYMFTLVYRVHAKSCRGPPREIWELSSGLITTNVLGYIGCPQPDVLGPCEPPLIGTGTCYEGMTNKNGIGFVQRRPATRICLAICSLGPMVTPDLHLAIWEQAFCGFLCVYFNFGLPDFGTNFKQWRCLPGPHSVTFVVGCFGGWPSSSGGSV